MGTINDLPINDGPITVELLPGAVVELAPGSVVELAPGTTVELATGTAVSIIENLRQRILKSPFLTRAYVYLDFGSKNQRLSTLIYSATGETQSLLRTFSYTLEGTKYKLISDVWSVI